MIKITSAYENISIKRRVTMFLLSWVVTKVRDNGNFFEIPYRLDNYTLVCLKKSVLTSHETTEHASISHRN